MIFISFIILFSSLSSGSGLPPASINTAIQTVIDVNQGKLISGPDYECANFIPLVDEKKRAELYNQCAVNLCGPPEKNQSVWLVDDNFLKSLSPVILKKVEAENKLFTKIFNIAQKDKIRELEALISYLQKPTLITSLSEEESFNLAEILLSPHVMVVTNQEMPLGERYKAEISPPPGASKEMIEALNDFAQNAVKARYLNTLLSHNLTSLEKETVARDTLKEIKIFYKDNVQLLDPQFLKTLHEVEQRLDKTTSNDLDDILDVLREISLKKRVSNVPVEKCSTPKCIKFYESFFKNPSLLRNLELHKKVLTNPQTITDAINSCKAAIIIKEEKSSDLKKAQKIFSEARANIIKNFLPKFSKESADEMLYYLNNRLVVSNQNILLAGDTDNTIKLFRQKSAQYIKDHKEPAPKMLPLNALLKISKIQNSSADFAPFEELFPCKDFEKAGRSSWDIFAPIKEYKKIVAADPEANKQKQSVISKMPDRPHVFVSEFSCQHTDLGKFALAHEIGHALRYLFSTAKLSDKSKEKFVNVRKCISSNYPDFALEENDLAYFFPDDTLYTEEDMADLIALTSAPKDPRIYACSFLQTNIEKSAYKNLSFLLDLDRYQEVPHSTNFSRVLFETINKGIPLPTSCLELIIKEQPNMSFNKCEF